MHPRYRKTCRVCGSTKLKPVIDLGDQYLQGSFVKPGVLRPPLRKLPTQLVRCDVTEDEDACGLLALAHTFPPEILYANYWYRSGTNATMREHLRGIVTAATAMVGASSGKLTVLDIGCNDGTLLSYYPEGTRRFGVDPSDIANEIQGDVTVINALFPSSQALATLPRGGAGHRHLHRHVLRPGEAGRVCRCHRRSPETGRGLGVRDVLSAVDVAA
ncbi:MAG: class I SAM-dependent methyltransferase [Alphaproteobacteria bacterium]